MHFRDSKSIFFTFSDLLQWSLWTWKKN